MSDRERFEAWCADLCGPGSIKKWLSTDAYENVRVCDMWLGFQEGVKAERAATDKLRARILELEAVHEDASGAILAERARVARRCAEIADEQAIHWRNVYKGRATVEGRKPYDPHTDGMTDGADLVHDAILAEFPEAK